MMMRVVIVKGENATRRGVVAKNKKVAKSCEKVLTFVRRWCIISSVVRPQCLYRGVEQPGSSFGS